MEIFALIVLLILVISALAIWAMLGMYPGKIARNRNHPQAEAISVCGWLGAITMGILSPLAFIWAYTNPASSLSGRPREGGVDQQERVEDLSGTEVKS
jgi:glycerol uptake facilitator-like aquaporin